MAKRIDKARIDAGKVQLPRKLGFLTEQKVDYLSVTDRDGEFTVELSVSALNKLVKARNDLKALKADQKTAAAGHESNLAQEREAHEATKRELASAQRKLKKLKPAEAAAPAKNAVAKKAAPASDTAAAGNGSAKKTAPRKAAPSKAASKPAAAAPLTGGVENPAPVAPTAGSAAPAA